MNLKIIPPPSTAKDSDDNVDISFTKITSSDRLTKAFHLKDGELVKTSGTQMIDGTATLMSVPLEEFEQCLTGLGPNEATVLGTYNTKQHPIPVRIVTAKNKTGQHPEDDSIISRTKEYFDYAENQPGYLLLDHDGSLSFSEFRHSLYETLPEAQGAAMLQRASSGSHIYTTDGKCLRGQTGQHVFIPVSDASQISRMNDILHHRFWLKRYGRIDISKSGSLLIRDGLADLSAISPERLAYEADAVCGKGLEQRKPKSFCRDGTLFDISKIPDPTKEERAEVKRLIAEAKRKAEPEAAKVRAAYYKQERAKIRQHYKCSDAEADGILKSRLNGVLLGSDIVMAAEETIVAVSDILMAPEAYDHKMFKDPVEHDYDGGRTVAIFYTNSDGGVPIMFSHAHGGQIYRLQHDAKSLKKYVESAEPHKLQEDWQRHYLNSDLSPIEKAQIKKQIAKKLGVSKQDIDDEITQSTTDDNHYDNSDVASGGWTRRKIYDALIAQGLKLDYCHDPWRGQEVVFLEATNGNKCLLRSDGAKNDINRLLIDSGSSNIITRIDSCQVIATIEALTPKGNIKTLARRRFKDNQGQVFIDTGDGRSTIVFKMGVTDSGCTYRKIDPATFNRKFLPGHDKLAVKVDDLLGLERDGLAEAWLKAVDTESGYYEILDRGYGFDVEKWMPKLWSTVKSFGLTDLNTKLIICFIVAHWLCQSAGLLELCGIAGSGKTTMGALILHLCDPRLIAMTGNEDRYFDKVGKVFGRIVLKDSDRGLKAYAKKGNGIGTLDNTSSFGEVKGHLIDTITAMMSGDYEIDRALYTKTETDDTRVQMDFILTTAKRISVSSDDTEQRFTRIHVPPQLDGEGDDEWLWKLLVQEKGLDRMVIEVLRACDWAARFYNQVDSRSSERFGGLTKVREALFPGLTAEMNRERSKQLKSDLDGRLPWAAKLAEFVAAQPGAEWTGTIRELNVLPMFAGSLEIDGKALRSGDTKSDANRRDLLRVYGLKIVKSGWDSHNKIVIWTMSMT